MKKGVVWVSTVLYILISLAIVGIVIAAVTPRINSAKDKATIEQTITMLNEIDYAINQASQVQGTRLERDIKMSRGMLTVNPSANTITWTLDNSAYQYSEPNEEVSMCNLMVLTKKSQGGWQVSLTIKYSFDITSSLNVLQPSEIPYKLWIENKGNNIIDISTS